MFPKILWPVDLTDRHQQALDIAGELATQSRGAVTLLHVVEVVPGLSMEEEWRSAAAPSAHCTRGRR
jgi:Universal stress protein family